MLLNFLYCVETVFTQWNTCINANYLNQATKSAALLFTQWFTCFNANHPSQATKSAALLLAEGKVKTLDYQAFTVVRIA